MRSDLKTNRSVFDEKTVHCVRPHERVAKPAVFGILAHHGALGPSFNAWAPTICTALRALSGTSRDGGPHEAVINRHGIETHRLEHRILRASCRLLLWPDCNRAAMTITGVFLEDVRVQLSSQALGEASAADSGYGQERGRAVTSLGSADPAQAIIHTVRQSRYYIHTGGQIS